MENDYTKRNDYIRGYREGVRDYKIHIRDIFETNDLFLLDVDGDEFGIDRLIKEVEKRMYVPRLKK